MFFETVEERLPHVMRKISTVFQFEKKPLMVGSLFPAPLKQRNNSNRKKTTKQNQTSNSSLIEQTPPEYAKN